jgi:hypothetical protein
VEGRVLSADRVTGDFEVILRHAETGELAMLRGNLKTGNGIVTSLTYGNDLAVIRGGVIVPPAPGGALPPAADVPFAPDVPTGMSLVPVEAPPGPMSAPAPQTPLVSQAPPALPGGVQTLPVPLPELLENPLWLQRLPAYMQQDLLQNPPAMDPERTTRLQEAIRAYRRAGIVPRRIDEPDSLGIPVIGGTVAAAETDIGVFGGRVFPGASSEALPPALRGTPGTTGGDVFQPANPIAMDHAEHVALENLRAAIDAALAVPGASRAALLGGRTVFLMVEQEPCSSCASGAGEGQPGVIQQFSLRYPELTVEVRSMRTSRSYIYRNGVLLNP